MADLPTGTVTFLLTDVEGSTRLWEQHPAEMRSALARHDQLVREHVERHHGLLVKPRGEGDSHFAVFARATDAVAAALGIQCLLATARWQTPLPVPVRMALHTGETDLRDGDYYGTAVNRCARLRAIAHGGQVLLSTTTEGIVRDALPEGAGLKDLGVHRLRDLVRPERVYQLTHPGLPPDYPPLLSLDAHPRTFPLPTTRFVGRAAESEAVKQLLASTRLVTVTGVGGCGKTRLATQIALDIADRFSDGAFFVDLSTVQDPGLVAPAIAEALGWQLKSELDRDQALVDFLKDRQLLLVLDNFEHVSAAAPLIAHLISRCPRLTALVTSRSVLRLHGEQEYPLAPLQLPSARHPSSVEDLARFDAVQLLVERARNARPDFALTAENAQAVVGICRRLDGLPMAIELAAARMRLLSPEALLSQLGQHLWRLTTGSRDLPARQQTLRNTIQWSYDLLDDPEKELFRRIAVFVGGCSFEAGAVVCMAADGSEGDLLDLLQSLIDQSLLRMSVVAGVPRFAMLEIIREYALEKLKESGELDLVQRRHAGYMLGLAEAGPPAVWAMTPARSEALERLDLERDNLGAAIACAAAAGDPVESMRWGAAVGWFWWGIAYGDEARLASDSEPTDALGGGREVGDEARDHGDQGSVEMRAQAVFGAAYVAWRRGDYVTADELFRQSQALWPEGTTTPTADVERSLHGLMLVERWERLDEQAQSASQRAVPRPYVPDDTRPSAPAALHQGWLAFFRSDDEGAGRRFGEALSASSERGALLEAASAKLGLGWLAHRRGDLDVARGHYSESLELIRAQDDARLTPYLLERCAAVALDRGKLETAVRWASTATRLWEASPSSVPPAFGALCERHLLRARGSLGEECYSLTELSAREESPEQTLAAVGHEI